jgi:hypothetical protein
MRLETGGWRLKSENGLLQPPVSSLRSAFDDAYGAEAGDLAGQAGVLAGTPVCTRHFAGLPPLFLRGRAMEGRYEADRLVVN